jgi:hypothetical protein
MQPILSALNDLKANVEEIRRAATDSRDPTQGQRSDMEGRREEHERHRGNDESPSRCVQRNADDAEISMDTNPSITADYEQERQ